MASKAIELTVDEIKEIKTQVALSVTWYVTKRVLLIPLLLIVAVMYVVIGVSTDQLMHTLSGEHNVRSED